MARLSEPRIRNRSLYDCFHARVREGRIYCAKGHCISTDNERNYSPDIECLARGEALVFSICQDCGDFESMGNILLPRERGWMKRRNISGAPRDRNRPRTRVAVRETSGAMS